MTPPVLLPTTTICIAPDQLLPSSAPGKVRVQYPRGAASLLSFDNNGNYIQQTNLQADGAFEQATVLPNGNLLFLSDQPTSVPTLVPGAGLQGSGQ